MLEYLFRLPNFKLVASTYGNGFWSKESRKITHSRADISFYQMDDQIDFASDFVSGKLKYLKFAELRVYFPKKNWDVNKHGLIYTDRNWIKDLRSGLVKLGFSSSSVKSIDYSEQGMQGDNYVSVDVDKKFLKEASKYFSY